MALTLVACGDTTGQSGSGVAAKLSFTSQPGSASAGAPLAPFSVSIEDASGELVKDAGHAIGLALDNNPSSGVLSGTLSVNSVGGLATFSDVRIEALGAGYRLKASAEGLPDATSMPFDIGPPDAAGGSLAGHILLVAAHGARQQLYAVMPDGSGFVRISPATVADSAPLPSPDGRLLALTRDHVHIVVRDVADGGEIELTDLLYGRGLEWSPDSKWLAAQTGCCNAKRYPLRVVKIDGSGALDLATGCNTDFGGTISGYSWSPDATRLAYSDGAPAGCFGQQDLLTIGRDGAAGSPLTTDPGVNESYPAWSPEGTWIAFTTVSGCASARECRTLEMIRPDGTGRTTLDSVAPLFGYPLWSGDGARLAFGSESGLHVIDVETEVDRNLFPHHVTSVAWSPDGARLAFGSDSFPGLFLADIASNEVASLFPQAVTAVTWSPDASHIAFVGGDSAAQQVYVIEVDGANVRPLTGLPGDYFSPVWLP
jgi:Tol biopolymer transport system component